MKNNQPFYHRIDGLLFTSTTGLSQQQFLTAFEQFIKSKNGKQLGIVPGTAVIEDYLDPEPGDPADLM